MQSARVAVAMAITLMACGCQPSDEQKLKSWLSMGLPTPFANCVAERTFDALTPADVAAYLKRKATYSIDMQRSGTPWPAPPRTLAAAQTVIAGYLTEDAAVRMRRATARCHIHNWRLGNAHG